MDATLRSTPLCTLRLEGSNYVSPCRQSPLFLAAGRQLLSLIQLHTKPECTLEPPYQDVFEFSVVRHLQSRSTRLKLTNTAVAYHPENESIAATGSSIGAVCLWNVHEKKSNPLRAKWNAHSRSLQAMAFFPTARSDRVGLLTAFADGAFKHWLLHDPTPGYSRRNKQFTDGHTSTDSDSGTNRAYEEVKDIRVSSSRTPIRDIHVRQIGAKGSQIRILCAQEDGRVMLQEIAHGSFGTPYSYHVSAHAVYSVRFSNANDDIFCAASRDKHLRIFDCRLNDAPVANIVTGSPVSCARWRPHSSHVLASSAGIMDHNLLVWDMRKYHLPVCVFNSHKKGEPVSDFFWSSPDHIISSGKDGHIQLHALQNAVEPMRWTNVVSQTWSPSGVAVVNQHIEERLSNLAETQPSTWKTLMKKLDGEFYRERKEKKKLEETSPSESKPQPDATEIYSDPFPEVKRRAYVIPLRCWSPTNFASAAASRGFSRTTRPLEEQCQEWAQWCGVHNFIHHKQCFDLLALLVQRGQGVKKQRSSTERALGAAFGNPCEDAASMAATWMAQWCNETVIQSIKAFEEANDVGMCILLANLFDVQSAFSSDEWEEKNLDWSHSLVEFLARSRQFQDRAFFIKNCAIEEIRQLSHIALSINCAHCFTLLDAHASGEKRKWSASCPKCQRLKAVCAVCGQQCAGLWSTCQICGHGGHIHHLHEWFTSNTLCPAGCGHQCRMEKKIDEEN